MSSNFNVLVFEDDETSFKLIETALFFLKVNVFHAETGGEGIELFKKEKVDLIILDLNLPDMTGFDAAKELKKINEDIPIVAQTAYAANNEKKRCKDLGCDNFLLKPLNIRKLQKVIDKYKD